MRIRPGETEQAADRRFGTFLEGILDDKDTQPATKVTAHLILAVAKSAGVREQEKSLEKAKAHLEATGVELHKAIAVDFGDAMDVFLRNAKRRMEELIAEIREEEQEANGSDTK